MYGSPYRALSLKWLVRDVILLQDSFKLSPENILLPKSFCCRILINNNKIAINTESNSNKILPSPKSHHLSSEIGKCLKEVEAKSPRWPSEKGLIIAGNLPLLVGKNVNEAAKYNCG